MDDAEQLQQLLLRQPRAATLLKVIVTGDPHQLVSDLLRRKNEVDETRSDGGVGHAVHSRGIVLREGDAPFGFDFLCAECAVGRRSREDHRNRPAPLILSKGCEKGVDHRRSAAGPLVDAQHTVFD